MFGIIQKDGLLLLCIYDGFFNKLLLSRVDNAVLDLYVVMPTTPQRMQCTFTVSRVWANAK